MNTIIEKIRAEIERRMNGNPHYVTYKELESILSFLSDLEKSEKPINPVIQDFPTTEKEMQDFLATHERIPVPERLNSLERILQEQPVNGPFTGEQIYKFLKEQQGFPNWYPNPLEGQPVDLEKEIASFITKFGWGNTKHLAEKELINCTARHFAKWQKEQTEKRWLEDRDGCFWDGVEEGKKAMREQMMKEAVEGWVARDGFGGNVSFFSYKPYRPSEGLGIWKIRKGGVVQLPKDIFPDLKWEDEPKKVKLIIVKED